MRADEYGRDPNPSTITRTSIPSARFCSSSAARCVPTSPARQPNIRMCTEVAAASTSAKMRGKKLAPSTHGSIVAAVDHANGSAASRGRVPARAANAAVAASAPADVAASGGGGQHERCGMASTRRMAIATSAAAIAANLTAAIVIPLGRTRSPSTVTARSCSPRELLSASTSSSCDLPGSRVTAASKRPSAACSTRPSRCSPGGGFVYQSSTGRKKSLPARRRKRAGRRGNGSGAGTSSEAAEGTRTLDLLHGKQTL